MSLLFAARRWAASASPAVEADLDSGGCSFTLPHFACCRMFSGLDLEFSIRVPQVLSCRGSLELSVCYKHTAPCSPFWLDEGWLFGLLGSPICSAVVPLASMPWEKSFCPGVSLAFAGWLPGTLGKPRSLWRRGSSSLLP